MINKFWKVIFDTYIFKSVQKKVNFEISTMNEKEFDRNDFNKLSDAKIVSERNNY